MSPMETMPTSRPLSTTGRWRIRFSVIVWATVMRSSCGDPVITSRVMMSVTFIPNTRSFFAASRTTSRSDRIPTGWPASSTAMSAPTLCFARSPSASRIGWSGRTVYALSPFFARMLAMFMDPLLLLEDRSFDVLPPHVTQPAHDLAHRGPRLHELDRHRHQVDRRVGRLAGQPLEERGDARVVARRARGAEPLDLPRLHGGVHAMDLDGAWRGRLDKLVDADHGLGARGLSARLRVRGVGDFALEVPLLDRLHRPTQSVHLPENRRHLGLDPAGQRLDIV